MATDFLTTGNDIVSHIAGSRVECFEYDNMAASPPHAASGIFAAVAARGASGLYNLLARAILFFRRKGRSGLESNDLDSIGYLFRLPFFLY